MKDLPQIKLLISEFKSMSSYFSPLIYPFICSSKHWVQNKWPCLERLEATWQKLSVTRVGTVFLKGQIVATLGFVGQKAKCEYYITFKSVKTILRSRASQNRLGVQFALETIVYQLLIQSWHEGQIDVLQGGFLFGSSDLKPNFSLLLTWFFKSWDLIFHFMGIRRLAWLFITFN